MSLHKKITKSLNEALTATNNDQGLENLTSILQDQVLPALNEKTFPRSNLKTINKTLQKLPSKLSSNSLESLVDKLSPENLGSFVEKLS